MTKGCKFGLMALLMAASLTLGAHPVQAASGSVYHTVVFWLKPDAPAGKAAEIIKNAKGFEKMPMVEKVLIGTPIMSDRKVVDDSFSVAFTMVFKNKAALDAYNADPHHKKISREKTLPFVARGVIYDYVMP